HRFHAGPGEQILHLPEGANAKRIHCLLQTSGIVVPSRRHGDAHLGLITPLLAVGIHVPVREAQHTDFDRHGPPGSFLSSPLSGLSGRFLPPLRSRGLTLRRFPGLARGYPPAPLRAEWLARTYRTNHQSSALSSGSQGPPQGRAVHGSPLLLALRRDFPPDDHQTWGLAGCIDLLPAARVGHCPEVKEF